jgi:hypothetical protein
MLPKRTPTTPKQTVYDKMSDAEFVQFLERGERIPGEAAAAIERRVAAVKGALYDEASRLFLRNSSSKD